jgi:hypothetical protein
MPKLIASCFVVLLLAAACDPPKQQRPPRIPDEDPATEGGDIVAPEEKEVAPVEEAKETPAQLKHRCCNECVKGMAADRSGDTADKIPCADFTSTLAEDCLAHFRKESMMASAADACAKDVPPEGATPEKEKTRAEELMKGGGGSEAPPDAE